MRTTDQRTHAKSSSSLFFLPPQRGWYRYGLIRRKSLVRCSRYNATLPFRCSSLGQRLSYSQSDSNLQNARKYAHTQHGPADRMLTECIHIVLPLGVRRYPPKVVRGSSRLSRLPRRGSLAPRPKFPGCRSMTESILSKNRW